MRLDQYKTIQGAIDEARRRLEEEFEEKERLSRAILPRHKPINLADVILSHPPISTRMTRTLLGLPAHPAAPVEQAPATQPTRKKDECRSPTRGVDRKFRHTWRATAAEAIRLQASGETWEKIYGLLTEPSERTPDPPSERTLRRWVDRLRKEMAE